MDTEWAVGLAWGIIIFVVLLAWYAALVWMSKE